MSFYHINIDHRTLMGSLRVFNPPKATIAATDVDSWQSHCNKICRLLWFFFSWTHFTQLQSFVVHKHINSNTQLRQISRPGMLINRKVFSQMKQHAMDNTSYVWHSKFFWHVFVIFSEGSFFFCVLQCLPLLSSHQSLGRCKVLKRQISLCVCWRHRESFFYSLFLSL